MVARDWKAARGTPLICTRRSIGRNGRIKLFTRSTSEYLIIFATWLKHRINEVSSCLKVVVAFTGVMTICIIDRRAEGSLPRRIQKRVLAGISEALLSLFFPIQQDHSAFKVEVFYFPLG